MTLVEENYSPEHAEMRMGPSLPELIKRLRDESATLFRQEVALAKAEISEKAAHTIRNAVYLAVGGLVAYAGLLFLLLGVDRLIWVGLGEAGVPERIAAWVAPFIVGGCVGAVGFGFVQRAIAGLRRQRMTPERTVQSLQENKEWLEQKIR
jgi:hypothetical protein